ncbi:response regulator [Paenibacillus puerhi]|uniref:response regulator n=1 Tax=Paenibacillus puerhi TaxID=2692622 RepID=UPI001356954C|nr:response regulator [Paenibacillus puerhi]
MSNAITLCVIDDMKSVTDGIARQIPWADYGVTVIGTASDGEEGLRLIRTAKPDVILTDIRMPHLDGLDMMTTLRSEVCECKVIFFSGYTDFDYVQQALRLGAFDYITKPFSIQQIIDIVMKARSAIEAARAEERRLEAMKRRVQESLPLLRQELFHLILHHKTDWSSIRPRWEFLQIGLEPRSLSVLVIEIDHFAEQSRALPTQEVELIRFSMQNILEETIASFTKGLLFRESSCRFVAVYQACPSRGEETGLAELCREHIARYTKFTVSIGQGRTADDVSGLPEAFREALFALSYQFYASGNVALLYDDVAGSSGPLPRYSKDKEQELAMWLRSGNAAQSTSLLEELFRELSSGQALPEPIVLVSVLSELASFIVRVLLEKVPYAELHPLERKLRERLALPAVSLKDLQQQLVDLARDGCSLIESRHRSESQLAVNEAIRYIRAQLHTELTLNECAKHVHLSSNYFVNLFKKVTGITFVQFLTQERMEQAKRLLLEDKQVQDIAAAVGYEDRRYFSDVFKKTVGMTPTEFKTAYLKGGKAPDPS